MANISSLLEIIRTAHLGRDMRQALHDSIQAVNNDTENALGKSLTFTNATRKLSLKAKDGTVLSEAVIPGGGSGGGSVDSVNGVAPDENGNVQLTASDVGAMSSSAGLNDISDVTLSSPSNGQVLGYDGSKWTNVSGGSGGGHTIKNESGTALTQRDNLQFKGCAVSDDSTNNATVVSVQTSNRNLLDNAWFTVNQKGVTSGQLLADNPAIDRWKTSYGADSRNTWQLTSNGLNLNTVNYDSFGYWYQMIEDANLLNNKQVTGSILLSDGTIKSGTITRVKGSQQWFYYGNDFRFYCYTDGNNEESVIIEIPGGQNITIKAVKLEIGSQSTLAFDTAPDYTTELLKCQRYLYRITSATQCYIGMAGNTSTNLACWFVNLPTPMRTTPTISTGGTIKLVKGGTEVSVTSIATNLSGASDILSLGITPSSALDVNSSYLVQMSGNSYIDFDAQL